MATLDLEREGAHALTEQSVSILREKTIDEFLSYFGLSMDIKKALLSKEIDSLSMLFECDLEDILSISKTFSSFENITLKDKIYFKKIMKDIIRIGQQCDEEKCDAKMAIIDTNRSNIVINCNKSMQHMPLILSDIDHSTIKTIYAKLNEIEIKRKNTESNLTLINSKYEENQKMIKNHFKLLAKTIKQKQNQLLKEYTNKINCKTEEYNDMICKLNEFESIIKKEIESIEFEWLSNNNNSNNKSGGNNSVNSTNATNNNDKHSKIEGNLLKQCLESPNKYQLNLEESLSKIENYEKENFRFNFDNSINLIPSIEFGGDFRNFNAMLGYIYTVKIIDNPNVQGLLHNDAFYETKYDRNKLFNFFENNINEIKPESDEKNEILIFECEGLASRFETNTNEWRKRGQGTMKLFHNNDRNVIRMEFFDKEYYKIRLKQTFYPFFDFQMYLDRWENNQSSNCIIWRNTDYVTPKPVTSNFKIEMMGQTQQQIENANKFLTIIKDFYYALGLPPWCAATGVQQNMQGK